jgi:hypothetical protein
MIIVYQSSRRVYNNNLKVKRDIDYKYRIIIIYKL